MGYILILFGFYVVICNCIELIDGSYQVPIFIMDSILATCLLGFGFVLTNIYKIQRILQGNNESEKPEDEKSKDSVLKFFEG